MDVPQRIRRLAPVAAVAAGLVTLGAAAGGIASMDGALVTAAAEQRQTRFIVDRSAPQPAAARLCPDGAAPAPGGERWES